MINYIATPSPKDMYTYRLTLREPGYESIVVDYWNPTIISSQTETNVSHELQFEFAIIDNPKELSPDETTFKHYLSDIIIEEIVRKNGTLEFPAFQLGDE